MLNLRLYFMNSFNINFGFLSNNGSNTPWYLTKLPMINTGKYDVKMLNDGWTAVTKDKSLSAQFEHTLGITENGYEIFTESAKGYSKPPYL